MEFFKKEFDQSHFTLYPLGDWHLGSKQCDEKFIKQVIEDIYIDENAYWVGMGDLMENAVVGSKSDVYTQTLPPKEQLEYICELLNPIREKGLFLIAGNHEARTHRLVGMRPEEFLSIQLKIPYKGFSCYALFSASEKGKIEKGHRGFKCYFHHDYGGGYTPGGKINAADKLRLITPTADAIFAGHFHVTSRLPIRWADIGSGGKHIWRKEGYNYITGSALTWDSSYAEERGKPMASLEFIRVAFKFGTMGSSGEKSNYDHREQVYEVIKPR